MNYQQYWKVINKNARDKSSNKLGIWGRFTSLIIGVLSSAIVSLFFGGSIKTNVIVALVTTVVWLLVWSVVFVWYKFHEPIILHNEQVEKAKKKEQKIRLLEKKIKDPPELIKLANLRTTGFLLRNEGKSKSNEKEVNNWIVDFEKWNELLVKTVKSYSPVRASMFEVVGNLPRGGYPNAINERHRLKLNVFDEKLKRLQTLLEEHKPRKN